jgi:Tfp pilus assembly protein PilN
MVASINLIPEEEIVQQRKTKAVKFSTILAIILLVITGGASYHYFNETSNLKNEKAQLEGAIASLQNDVTSLSSVEVDARNLSKKYSALVDIIGGRPHYSLLLQEIRDRTPSGVELSGFTVRGGKIELLGTAESYFDVASYITNLSTSEFVGGNKNLKEVFTTVNLQSVNLLESSKEVSFGISVAYDESLLNAEVRGL